MRRRHGSTRGATRTDALSRVVQRWRKPSNAILRRAYRADAKYIADLHVFAPTPVNAPGLVRDLLNQDAPFAVLIPSDLVQCVSEVGRKVDKALKRRVAQCAKLTFLAGGLTWVVGGLGTSAHLILAGAAVEDGAGGGQGATLTTITPPPKIKGWLREDVGSLEDWAGAAQASLHTEAAKLRKVTITVQQDSGLAHMSRSDDPLS